MKYYVAVYNENGDCVNRKRTNTKKEVEQIITTYTNKFDTYYIQVWDCKKDIIIYSNEV